jgi:lysozyme family protein
MADFLTCFKKVMALEGGYKLHTVKGDRGGMTYAGISRQAWPNWQGWEKIDYGEYGEDLFRAIEDFYRSNYWDKINGDRIKSQHVAYMIYDFAVNAGVSTSARIAQRIVGAKADGDIGPKTLQAMDEYIKDEKDERIFITTFSLLKVFRYKDICLNDKRRSSDKVESNLRFICGWINRVQKGVE